MYSNTIFMRKFYVVRFHTTRNYTVFKMSYAYSISHCWETCLELRCSYCNT